MPNDHTPALHSSAADFRAMFEHSALGMARVRLSDGRWLDVNDAFCRMLGRERAALLTMTWLQTTHPDDIEPGHGLAAQLASGQVASATLEKRYLHDAGHAIWIRVTLSLVRDPGGASDYALAIVEDIRDRKAMEEELVRSRAQLEAERTRLQAIVDTIPTGLIMLDESGEMVIENDEWKRTWAGSGRVNGVIDYSLYKGFRPETGEAIAGEEWPCAMSLKQGIRTRDVILDIERFNGKRGTIVVSSAPIRDETGRVVAAVAANMDITELRAAQDQLVEQGRRKTEFLATLAHELRNPLAPIRSGLQVLALSGDNAAAVAKVRDMMERQVGHMVHLIDDLLDVARISGGKLELKKTHADLRQVLSSAVETSLPGIEARQHALRVDVPAEAMEAEVDVTRIAQVVGNLLNNAAKYTPAGGHIELVMRRDDGAAVITVGDDGIGIPDDALERVFDMFSQVGHTLDQTGGGLGIGLSLVRRLVEMHGGSVAARSAGTGAGSTFTVRLPLLPAAAAEAPRVAGSATGAGVRMKVLVADDNADAAATLAMILELQGHDVRTACDGVDALAQAQHFAPDLVLLDIGMPRMDGYDAARAICRIPGLERVRLMALTGWGAQDDRDRSAAAGFDFHLTKPVQMTDLERIVAGVAAAIPCEYPKRPL